MKPIHQSKPKLVGSHPLEGYVYKCYSPCQEPNLYDLETWHINSPKFVQIRQVKVNCH